MRHIVRAIFLFNCLLPAFLQAQQKCGAEAAIAQVRDQRTGLLKVSVEEMATTVPVVVQTQIHGFKDSLSSVIEAEMGCLPVEASAAAIQNILETMLGANRTAKPSAPPGDLSASETEVYGRDLKIHVLTPSNAPQVRGVQISFGIPCGDDSMLLLYEADSHRWHSLLRWQSEDYSEISDAFGDFFVYSIIPATASDALRVAVAHGSPWCTSRFSGFKIDLLKSSEDQAAPPVVWHTERGYSRGDYVAALKNTAEGFELRINAPALSVEGYERTVVYRYQVQGNVVRRVSPIAVNGRGFVEEWLSMPWDEAAGQTAEDAVPAMKIVHERIAQADIGAKTYVSYGYGPVRACLVKGQYEVEMDADPGGPQFFAIRQVPNGYVMINFGTTQDERCSGPDLMKRTGVR